MTAPHTQEELYRAVDQTRRAVKLVLFLAAGAEPQDGISALACLLTDLTDFHKEAEQQYQQLLKENPPPDSI